MNIAQGNGRVSLVGAGPGDPELLTLKALRVLQQADVVLYDRLVTGAVLELVRLQAKKILVGKKAGGPQCRQADICSLLVRLACRGHHVVRLKGGDPMVFGRAIEEIGACRAAGLRVDVIPGITAALGIASELQIPLTGRQTARRLQFVTGHTVDGGAPDMSFGALNDGNTTTVLYMGRHTLPQTVAQLLEQGLDKKTPSCAVFSGTTSQSRTVFAPISELSKTLGEYEDDGGPCLIFVGQSVSQADVCQTNCTSQHQWLAVGQQCA